MQSKKVPVLSASLCDTREQSSALHAGRSVGLQQPVDLLEELMRLEELMPACVQAFIGVLCTNV